MNLVLAPMEGLTDPLMRRILTHIAQYDWCVSEFIRITDSVLPDYVYEQYCPELHHDWKTDSGTPIHVQFLGNNLDMLARNAQKVATLGVPAIDLNFGCPAKTVNRHRGGAVLLDEPDTLFEIVQTVRQAVPRSIPVSAKIRLGYLDDIHTLENALAIQAAGASWLTIHARTKADGYTPPAYWEKIKPLHQHITIPIIANGEIWSLDDARHCQAQSGCTDLMLGRGAVTMPDLATHIRHHGDESRLSWQQLIELQLQFLAGYYKTELGLIGRYKQWLGMLTKGYPEAVILWQTAKKIKTMPEMLELLLTFKSSDLRHNG